jgi:hypothetical protein
MYYNVKRLDYFYTTVKDQPGEAYKLLSTLADLGVNLLAFNAVPLGSAGAQLSLFPQDSSKLTSVTSKAGLVLEGPNPALLIQGDDDMGVLAEIHQKLFSVDINVYSAIGVTCGKGAFGYLVYLRPDEYGKALKALEK